MATEIATLAAGCFWCIEAVLDDVAARAAIMRAQADSDRPIVTTIEPLATWYEAEDYHQEYFAREGSSNPYCMAIVAPKLQKFRKSYAARLKR